VISDRHVPAPVRAHAVRAAFAAGVSLLLFAAAHGGPAIRSIAVRGNSVYSVREISGWLTSHSGSPFSTPALRGDSARVVDEYRAGGYLAARARFDTPSYSPDSAFVDLLLVVEEGRRTIVSRIAVEGSVRLSQGEILERFDAAPGEPLNPQVLERDIDELLARYEKLGYPFARCAVGDLTPRPGAGEDSVALTLRVDEGDRISIDEVRVEGNRETASSVITREARLAPGEPYSPAKVDAIRQRLNRLNIFSSVEEPELYVRDGHGGLLLRVREGNTNTFDGILGYLPPPVPGASGTFTGLASVAMRNLFGTGRKLSLRWQREDRLSQEIGVRYVEPWIFGFPVNVGTGFLQRQQDTTYVKRTLDLQAEFLLSEEFSLSLVVGSERVIPAVDSAGIVRAAGTSETTAGIALQYDNRDDLYSPTSGARYMTDYHYGRKLITSVPPGAAALPTGSGTVQRLGVDMEFYLPTLRRQVFAFGVHGREIRTGEVQPGEMYQFGGANTLRGYRENQFIGAEIAWANTEYRFILARRTFLFGFLDTGYYDRPGDDLLGVPAARAFKYGYGIGVRLETPLGNMGVSFALGQGDTFATAKIHIGIINDF